MTRKCFRFCLRPLAIGVCCLAAAATVGCVRFHTKPVCTEDRRSCIDQALNRACTHADNQQWAKAVHAIDQVLSQFPNEPELIRHRRQYEALRRQVVADSRFRILLARGRYLLDVRKSRENLFSATKDRRASRREYRVFQQEVAQTADALFQKGQQAIKEKDYGTAGRALSLSNRLMPSTAARQMLEEIHLRRQEKRAAALENKQSRDQQQWSLLMADFQESMENGNLYGARQILAEMEALNPAKSDSMRRRLQALIDQEVETLLARGRFFYSRGDLQQALETWEQGLRLKPEDPRLQQHIERARTFLQNLDRWEK